MRLFEWAGKCAKMAIYFDKSRGAWNEVTGTSAMMFFLDSIPRATMVYPHPSPHPEDNLNQVEEWRATGAVASPLTTKAQKYDTERDGELIGTGQEENLIAARALEFAAEQPWPTSRQTGTIFTRRVSTCQCFTVSDTVL